MDKYFLRRRVNSVDITSMYVNKFVEKGCVTSAQNSRYTYDEGAVHCKESRAQQRIPKQISKRSVGFSITPEMEILHETIYFSFHCMEPLLLHSYAQSPTDSTFKQFSSVVYRLKRHARNLIENRRKFRNRRTDIFSF